MSGGDRDVVGGADSASSRDRRSLAQTYSE